MPIDSLVTRPVALLASGGSRRGREVYEELEADFGPRLTYCELVKHSDEWTAAVKRARKAGAEVIAVGGGDGTVHYAAPLVESAGAILGLVPLGTGNALARDVGIPLDPHAALRLCLQEGIVARMDGAMMNEHPFLTVATTGLTSRIAKIVAAAPKKKLGRLVYVPAVLRAALLSRAFAASITADGESFTGRAWQIVVSNTRTHGGPFVATPSASPNNGKLGVYVVSHRRRAVLVRYFIALMRGKHTDMPEVWSTDASHIEIRLSRMRTIILDGEKVRARICDFHAQPGRYRLIVPPGSPLSSSAE